jgi:Holliday junction resolvasome RuvABC DNA-binding subunit
VEREEMDRECRESFKAELEERVSDLVAMGFDPDEVKDVMENTLYDSELAIRILQKVCTLNTSIVQSD